MDSYYSAQQASILIQTFASSGTSPSWSLSIDFGSSTSISRAAAANVATVTFSTDAAQGILVLIKAQGLDSATFYDGLHRTPITMTTGTSAVLLRCSISSVIFAIPIVPSDNMVPVSIATNIYGTIYLAFYSTLNGQFASISYCT